MKLEINHLNLSLEKQPILRDLSLEVEEGSFLTLLGPSGCGKTTLLKAIAGLLPIQSGQIRIDGHDVTGVPAHKRGAVIVFQDIRLFPHLSVAENVAYPMRMQGIDRHEARAQTSKLLEKIGLSGFEERRIQGLSGGQQQRIALIRALAARPSLLLLDEPFSSLDPHLRREARELVQDLHREFSMTTLLVTHDQREALALADRVAIMFDGEIAQSDYAETLYEEPANKKIADYLGGRSYIKGSIRSGFFESKQFGLQLPANSQRTGDALLTVLHRNLKPDPEGQLHLTTEAVHYQGDTILVHLRDCAGNLWVWFTYEPPVFRSGDPVRFSFPPEHARYLFE